MNSELVITLVPWDTKGKNLEKQISLVIKTKLLCLGELLTSNQNEEASKNDVALGSMPSSYLCLSPSSHRSQSSPVKYRRLHGFPLLGIFQGTSSHNDRKSQNHD